MESVANPEKHAFRAPFAPAFATAYQWDSEALILSGDVEGALVQLRRARALDPLSMIIRASLAQTLALLGRRDDAIAELRDALTLDPTFPRTRRELARQLLASGHTDEALSEARKLAELAPDNLPALATHGLCLGRAGHAEEARALLRRLESERGKPFVSTLEFARITAGLGDRAATLGYLERAVEAREGFLPFIGVDPEFDFLHGEPRYAAIVREVGIPPR